MAQETSTKKFFNGLYESPEYVVGGADGSQPFVAVPKGDGIYEDPKNGLIFFPVAGYTKPVTCHVGFSELGLTGEALQAANGKNRQDIIKQLLNAAALRMGPPGTVGASELIKIKLVREPNNPYDKDAVLVMASVTPGNQLYPIGYVPSKINTIVTTKKAWFHEEDFIVVFRMDDKGKHIKAQLCVKYELPEPERNRFQNIEYE